MTLYDRTDKFTNGYLPTYLSLAYTLGPDANVLELGVQRGGSLELWQVLFPGGVILGVDCDPAATWPEGTEKLVWDQQDEDLPHAVRKIAHRIDLIVDDASHRGDLTAAAWRNLWPLVEHGGFYVIEDWGVGWPGAPMYEPAMRALAMDLVDKMGVNAEIDLLEYRDGLIVMQKR